MEKKKHRSIYIILILALLAYFLFSFRSKSREIILTNIAGTNVKVEDVSPIVSSINVASEEDTDVVFTDTRTGKTIKIGYLSPGMVEKVELQKRHWYKVEARGTIKVYWADVRDNKNIGKE